MDGTCEGLTPRCERTKTETKGIGAGGGDALPRRQHNQFQVTFHINGGQSADCPAECRDVSAAFTLPTRPHSPWTKKKKTDQLLFSAGK